MVSIYELELDSVVLDVWKMEGADFGLWNAGFDDPIASDSEVFRNCVGIHLLVCEGGDHKTRSGWGSDVRDCLGSTGLGVNHQ